MRRLEPGDYGFVEYFSCGVNDFSEACLGGREGMAELEERLGDGAGLRAGEANDADTAAAGRGGDGDDGVFGWHGLYGFFFRVVVFFCLVVRGAVLLGFVVI
jgi:hypothetical protein